VSGLLLWLGAGALGAAGSVARFTLDGAVARRREGGGLPWGTLTVNVLGSLALGLAAGAGLDGDARFLLAGGLLGSFTTFSTWMLETHRLAEEGEGRAATANLVLSAALGLGALGAGWWMGSLL
jgi:CrcB protein